MVKKMYLKEGRSLVLKVPKSPKPPPFFVLNTAKTSAPLLKESDVLNRLNHEPDLALAMEFFKSVANSGAFNHTPSTYSSMIHRLAGEGHIHGVQYLLHNMKLGGFRCSEDLFVSVINSYRQELQLKMIMISLEIFLNY